MTVDTTLEREDLEYRLLYSALVAGKTATFAEKALWRLLHNGILPPRLSPFGIIRYLDGWPGRLRGRLEAARTGSYRRLERCLPALVALDPATCTIEDLEAVHGIGPKTARFFVLWTRPGARVAALDVHVLRWLRGRGHDAPASTPGSPRRYAELERVFLAEADRRGVEPRSLDHWIWANSNVGGIR